MTAQLSQTVSAEATALLTSEELLPLVYDELRQLAAARLHQEKPGQTLQPTALVHEVYLRLSAPSGQHRWETPGHFFAAAAEAMRRILINRARDKGRLKRGGDRRRHDLEQIEVAFETPAAELLLFDEALTQLAATDQTAAELVKLHFFAGLTLDDAAAALGVSRRTVDRLWAYARAWLYEHLRSEGASGPE